MGNETDRTAPPDPGLHDGLRSFLSVMRRRWILILIPVIVGAAGAYLASAAQESQYSAASSLLFRNQDLASIFGDTGSSATSDPTRRAQTNVELVSAEQVAERAWTKLGRPGSLGDFQKKVSVAQLGGSDLVSVRVVASDPQFAADAANTWANEYIAFRREADRAQIVQTISLIDARLGTLSADAVTGTEGQTLRGRRDQLEILASLQTGNAELVDPARPSLAPVAPRPVRNAVLAGSLCLLLGIGLVLVGERMDRGITRSSDLRRLGLPILGYVPKAQGRGQPTAAQREAFRLIRTNITFFRVDRHLDSLLITSAGQGEGKSTIASNLAQAFADFGADTLLIEADLRRPVLAQRLRISSARGLTNLLVSDIGLEEALQPVSFGTNRDVGPTGRLDVVTSGPIPPNPQELLESGKFHSLMEELRKRYDIIIVDGPPMLGLGDAVALTREVSGVVVVARLRTTRTDAVERLRAHLGLLEIRPLGVVLNGVGSEDAYSYEPEKRSAIDSKSDTGTMSPR